MVTTREVPLPRSHPPRIRTEEATLALLQRLAVHYPDAVIAGVSIGKAGPRPRGTLHGECRRQPAPVPAHPPLHAAAESPEGELVTIKKAAALLGLVPSTIHRCSPTASSGEQLTPGAPWQIRLTNELRARFVEEAPPEYLRCSKRPSGSASRGKRCCSVSSAASSRPCMCGAGVAKACESKCWIPNRASFHPHHESGVQ